MTFGVVSVLADDKMAAKIIAAEDGYFAHFVTAEILELGRVPTAEQAYAIADKYHFGKRDTLVVIGPAEIIYRGKTPVAKDEAAFRERCHRTFGLPGYNPWNEEDVEIAEFAESVNFRAGQEPELRVLGMPADTIHKPFIKESNPQLDAALAAYKQFCQNYKGTPEPSQPDIYLPDIDFGRTLMSLIGEPLSFRPVEEAVVNACQTKENAIYAAEDVVAFAEDATEQKDRILASAGRIINRLQQKFEDKAA